MAYPGLAPCRHITSRGDSAWDQLMRLAAAAASCDTVLQESSGDRNLKNVTQKEWKAKHRAPLPQQMMTYTNSEWLKVNRVMRDNTIKSCYSALQMELHAMGYLLQT